MKPVDGDWQFDPATVLGPATTFPMLWYDLARVRDIEHLDYDALDDDGKSAAWQISAAICNRIPLELQVRACFEGKWVRIVERSKKSVRALVGKDYREEAWHAGKVLALEDIAIHCEHRFPGNPQHT